MPTHKHMTPSLGSPHCRQQREGWRGREKDALRLGVRSNSDLTWTRPVRGEEGASCRVEDWEWGVSSVWARVGEWVRDKNKSSTTQEYKWEGRLKIGGQTRSHRAVTMKTTHSPQLCDTLARAVSVIAEWLCATVGPTDMAFRACRLLSVAFTNSPQSKGLHSLRVHKGITHASPAAAGREMYWPFDHSLGTRLSYGAVSHRILRQHRQWWQFWIAKMQKKALRLALNTCCVYDWRDGLRGAKDWRGALSTRVGWPCKT